MESRSHIAGMSPVITWVVPSSISLTVVFRVLVKQLRNTSARYGSSLHLSSASFISSSMIPGFSIFKVLL